MEQTLAISPQIKSPIDEFEDLFDNEAFRNAFVMTLERFSDIRGISDSLHRHADVFLCIDELLTRFESAESLKPHLLEMKALRDIVRTYSCIKEFAPRVCVLLRNSIIFVMNGLASKKMADQISSAVALEDNDVKRLGTVYATIILNITTNPKIWAGATLDITLLEWKQEMEKKNIDKKTFNAFRSYLCNKF